MPSTKKMKSDGIFSAIKALKEKLAELERRQNEREQNRGFSEGGASVKSSGKEGAEDAADIANQIAAMEEELEKFEEQKAEIADSDDVAEAVSEEGNSNENTNPISSDSDDLEAVAGEYRALGIDCEVGISKSGDAAIIVKNPGDFQGKDLLEMSSDNLKEMVNELGNQQPSGSCCPVGIELVSHDNSRGGETPPH